MSEEKANYTNDLADVRAVIQRLDAAIMTVFATPEARRLDPHRQAHLLVSTVATCLKAAGADDVSVLVCALAVEDPTGARALPMLASTCSPRRPPPDISAIPPPVCASSGSVE
jgi:hypothetical protein